jgi:hypothetical protein
MGTLDEFDQKLDVSHVPVEIPSTHIGRGGVAIAQVEDVDHAHECRSVDGRSTALSERKRVSPNAVRASTESTLVLAGQILARTRCSQQSQTSLRLALRPYSSAH